MNQLSRVCMIADHNEKQIEYACVYPECNLKRFACGKCIKIGIHKHQQNIQSHILDNKELLEFLSQKLNNFQRGQDSNNKQDGKQKTNLLNQITNEIKNLLENILNMIDPMKLCKKQNHNDQKLNEILLKLNNEGFNQFDETQLNMLMFIDKQLGDIYAQISNSSNQIIQNAIRIQELCQSQQIDNSGLLQQIIDCKHNLITQDQVEGQFEIFASAISNDFKYIVSGGIV